jgi:hypothetical protein
LALMALLELLRADLPWQDSIAKREEMLQQTRAWLEKQFDGAGWHCTGAQLNELSDGLTLFLFAFLLRDESERNVPLPPAMVSALAQHLARCAERPKDYPNSVGYFGGTFTNHLGVSFSNENRRITFLWYAWAVGCAAQWLERCKRLGAPHEDIVSGRRLLAHLVISLGDRQIDDALSGWTFIAADTLYGLSWVPP